MQYILSRVSLKSKSFLLNEILILFTMLITAQNFLYLIFLFFIYYYRVLQQWYMLSWDWIFSGSSELDYVEYLIMWNTEYNLLIDRDSFNLYDIEPTCFSMAYGSK